MYKVSIPVITDEELRKRYECIKPIVQIDGEKYFLRNFKDDELRTKSYLWNMREDKREKVNIDEYMALKEHDFECIHKYGYHMFFKPSIAEVLAQIPDHLARVVNLFEIIDEPKTESDFSKNKIVFDNGYHISKVRLYVKRR